MKKFVSFVVLMAVASVAFAQFPPRVDDHFWRKKLLYRIDLQEKLNKPLKTAESALFLPREGKFENKKGIVFSLLSAFERSDIQYGYNPDSLDQPITFDQLKNKISALNSGGGGGGGGEAVASEGDGESFGDDDDFGDDEFGDESFGDDEAPVDQLPSGGQGDDFTETFAPLNYIIDIIEDRIFDKNKSDMYYDIKYIRLWYVDPQGTLYERPVIAFRYSEVMDVVLEQTQWKNRFNDAEYRSMKEIIELRLFNSFLTEVSGEIMGVGGLSGKEEGEKRRLEILEFEHNLWQY